MTNREKKSKQQLLDYYEGDLIHRVDDAEKTYLKQMIKDLKKELKSGK